MVRVAVLVSASVAHLDNLLYNLLQSGENDRLALSPRHLVLHAQGSSGTARRRSVRLGRPAITSLAALTG